MLPPRAAGDAVRRVCGKCWVVTAPLKLGPNGPENCLHCPRCGGELHEVTP